MTKRNHTFHRDGLALIMLAVLSVALMAGCATLRRTRAQGANRARRELGVFWRDAKAAVTTVTALEADASKFPWGLLVTGAGGIVGVGGILYGLRKAGLAKYVAHVASNLAKDDAALRQAAGDVPIHAERIKHLAQKVRT